MKKSELSDIEKAKIIGAHECGVNNHLISNLLGHPESTVRSIITKYKETGEIENFPRTGRPKIYTERDKRALARVIKKDIRLTRHDIKEELSFLKQELLSTGTIDTILKEIGFFFRTPALKPPLTKELATKRKAWVTRRINWVEEWKHILWSDESKFVRLSNDGRKHILRKIGTRLDPENVEPKIQHGGISVMFWGCMDYNGVGPLIPISGNMNADDYVELLDVAVKPFILDNFGEMENISFQQDNCSIHTATKTKNYLNLNGFNVLEWVSRSPDLNPIEHLWDHLKRQIRKQVHIPEKKKELIELIEKLWYEIPVEVVRKLIDSLPNRCQKIINANGYHINY